MKPAWPSEHALAGPGWRGPRTVAAIRVADGRRDPGTPTPMALTDAWAPQIGAIGGWALS